jgi:S-layer homology domain
MHSISMKTLAVRILSAGACLAVAAGSLLAAPASSSAPKRVAGSPTVHVTGTVTDGSGHGWPLFAAIVISSDSTEPATVYSDPVTGGYAADLFDGVAYTFAVTAMSAGYVPGGGAVTTAGQPVVADWTLIAGGLCNAPGYAAGTFGPAVLNEGFDAGTLPAGWSVSQVSGNATWQIYTAGDPCTQFDGNRTGGAGPYAVLNSDCDSNGFEPDDSSLVTPAVDLGASANAVIRWANDFIDLGFGAVADVDVSTDGGTTWTNVWEAPGDVPGPGTQAADMSMAAGHANVKARFHYNAFWAWWWQVDDVQVGPFACTVLPGGLVAGTVTDANTGLGLNGATVTNVGSSVSTTTIAAPGQGDGFYSFFAAGSGSQAFEASLEKYTSVTQNATVAANGAVRLDFSLPAGLLDAAPRPLNAIVSPGGTQELTLNLTNAGAGDGSFQLLEVNVPPPPPPAFGLTKPVSIASARDRRLGFAGVTAGNFNARGLKLLPPMAKAPANVPAAGGGAGNVILSYPTGFLGGYGLAYDQVANRLWVSNSDAPRAGLPGDGLDHQFLPDGTPTDETIDLSSTASDWQGDGTYNARTGMIWQTNVGYLFSVHGDKCLFEIDPVAKVVTGKQICGPWGETPQVGLAYDYSTDTYYAGDQLGVITHIDSAGNLIDSAYVGLQIAGLAYNPTTKHLFVGTFSMAPFDVYVMERRGDIYFPLKGFSFTSAGVPVLNPRGVSLEADCSGHLWAYDVFQQVVYEAESGETGWCVNDIPWVSETPTTGTIAGSAGARVAGGGATLPVTVTFESQGLLPGLRQGSFVFTTDTPNPVAPVPVSLTVLFNDVPTDSFAANFIYGAAGSGIMPGCSPQAPASSFCPNDVVTRRTMAGFIERAAHGALTPPPVYLGEFNDVLLGSFNSDYIQGLVSDGITAGCGGSNYCPDAPNTRAQMAVFIWKAQHGTVAPPACTPPGTFADVPCPDGFAVDYVEAIAAEGITAGCGNGNYCPTASITNAQMAVFLVKAFNVPYLP